MKYIFAIFISILLSGCLVKQNSPITYYELSTPKKELNRCDRRSDVFIHVQKIKSLSPYQTRNIIYKDGLELSYLQNVKFIAYPSDMIYKALILYLDQNCHIKERSDAQVSLEITLLDIGVTQNTAYIEILAKLTDKDKIILNKILSAKTTTTSSVAEALNASLETVFGDLHSILNEML
ncbi:hypothetical protein A0W86_08590 [Campylobacter fetus]|nr:hypothetical protein [Campylobacter fetus]